MRTMVARADLGYTVIGFVDDDPARGTTDIGRFRALGNLDRIESILTEEKIEEVIITLPWMYQRKIANLVSVCERRGVRPRAVPDLFQLQPESGGCGRPRRHPLDWHQGIKSFAAGASRQTDHRYFCDAADHDRGDSVGGDHRALDPTRSRRLSFSRKRALVNRASRSRSSSSAR